MPRPGLRPVPLLVAFLIAFLIAFLALSAVSIWGAGEIAGRRAAAVLATEARQRLQLYAEGLKTAIERSADLPAVAAFDPSLTAALTAPGDQETIDRANRHLAEVQAAGHATVFYLLDREGKTLAASNFDQPDSYVGQNFGFRPYFIDALAGRAGRYYAVGALTGIPGYFLSAPIRLDGQVLGVLAAKVTLDDIERSWQLVSDEAMVIDGNGVVILSSEPELRFRTALPLAAEEREALVRSRQYGKLLGPALDLAPSYRLGDAILRPSAIGDGIERVVEETTIDPYGWRLVLAVDADPLWIAVRATRVAAALVLLIIGLTALYTVQRSRQLRALAQTQAELAAAQLDLEKRVVERTNELQVANLALAAEVEERVRAEEELRRAQSDLVQSAKMAAIGQMAAGITHELNQPLTALRNMVHNASIFLEQGGLDEVAGNLRHIDGLVDRMADITSRLRDFSRRSYASPQVVRLRHAIEESLALMRSDRNRRAHIAVELPADDGVVFEPVRLEQVIVNLVRNALDAVAGREDGMILIRAEHRGDRIVLGISDNGEGVPPELIDEIFDPFVTTKPEGEGLGLGLAISVAIAREFGASLVLVRSCPGETIFEVSLVAAKALVMA
jgi:two-component system, NtrC family, C4-dicarboxylate transport sensor histidine kinase DctB